MEFSYEPYEKLSFNSYLQYETVEAFADVIALSNMPGVAVQTRLFWANGIVFRYISQRPSEALAKKLMERHLVWDHIEFAPMTEFIRQIRVEERPLVTITVLDVSNHGVFGQLTKWIKENLLR